MTSVKSIEVVGRNLFTYFISLKFNTTVSINQSAAPVLQRSRVRILYSYLYLATAKVESETTIILIPYI